MKSEQDIRAMLEKVRSEEGEYLKFDEQAIFAAYGKDNQNLSLPIKVLSIIGGILGSIAFVGFILVAGLYDSEVGSLVFGSMMFLGAIWMGRSANKIIVDTFTVAAYVIGLVLLTIGFVDFGMDEDPLCLTYIALGSPL